MTMINRYEETLYDAYAQVITVEDVYYVHKNEHQHIMIFHKPKSA